MPYSPEELDIIYGRVPWPEAPKVDDQTVPYKRLKQLANIIPNTVNDILAPVKSLIADTSNENFQQSFVPQKDTIPTFDIGPNKGTLDTVLNQIAPGLLSYAVPYGAISKMGKVAGIGSIGTEVLAQGVTNAYTSLTDDPEHALDSGVLGGVSGALQQALPRRLRVLPLAAASLLYGAKTDNITGAAINFGVNMLPGATKGSLSSVEHPAMREATPPTAEQSQKLSGLNVGGNEKGMEQAYGTFGEAGSSNLQPQGTGPEGLTQNFLFHEFDPVGQRHNFYDPATGDLIHSKLEMPEVSTKGKSVEQLAQQQQTKAGIDPKTIAEENGAKYDAFDPLTKQHQFTLQDEGNQSTFYVKPENMHAEGIKSAIESKRAEMSQPKITEADLPAYIEAVQQGKGDEWLADFKQKSLTDTKPKSPFYDLADKRAKAIGKTAETVDNGDVFAYQHNAENRLPDLSSAQPSWTQITMDAGDILRELSLRDRPAANYLSEKLKRIRQYLDHSKNNPGDSFSIDGLDHPNRLENFRHEKTIKETYKNHPFTTEEQRVAAKLAEVIASRDISSANLLWHQMDDLFKNKKLENQTPIVKGLQKLKSDISGETKLQTLGIIAAAGIPAAIAYHETKGDIGSTIAAGVLGLGLGIGGINAYKKLKAKVGEAAPTTAGKIPNATFKEKLVSFARDTAYTPAGQAVGGQGGIWANSLHTAEALTGWHSDSRLNFNKIMADGFISDQQQLVNDAFKIAKPYVENVSPAFKDASALYFRGQLADAKTIADIISRTGGDMKPATHLPEKWMVLADPKNTNTKGPGVDIWHVTESAKQELITAQRDALERLAISPADHAWKDFMYVSRQVSDTLQQTIHDALPPGVDRNRLLGTLGQHAVRSHEVITNTNVYPTEVATQDAMTRLGIVKENGFVTANASPNPTPTRVTPVSVRGTTVYMTPTHANDFQFLHSPESLRAEVRDYIRELKQTHAFKDQKLVPQDSEAFMGSLFTGRKELDAVTQALLETKTAPLDVVNDTLSKLLPNAQVSHFIQNSIGLTDEISGLRKSFSNTEYNKKVQDLNAIINHPATNPRDLEHAKFQHKELTSYGRMPENSRFGLASDTFVSRDLKRQLTAFDGSAFGILDNVIGKGLQKVTQIYKTAHIALSPAMLMRQVVQAPLMMLLGGVRDIGSILTGYKGYMNRSEGFGKWMQQHGVFSSSQVHGDWQHSIVDLLSGKAEATIWGKLKNGIAKAHTAFAAPDDIVRASSFMAEAKRTAQKLGVPLDSFDSRVGKAAMEFMARRVTNFSNLPQYVKIGSNIPGVNVFLGYTHEIARVLKNTAIDATRGDIQAGATIAGLSTFPFLIQKMSEDSLSSVDRAAWERAKAVAPDYSRSRFKAPLSRNKDGTFTFVDFTSWHPFNDFIQTATATSKGDFAGLAAVNPIFGTDKSPVFNMIVPQITGRDTHTQKEFQGGGDRIMNLMSQLLPSLTPGIGSEYKKIMPEALGGEFGLTNMKTGRTETGTGAILRNFAATNYTQVNPDIAVANHIKGVQHQLVTLKQNWMDTMKMQGHSKEAQERATARYMEAVHATLQEMEYKLNLTEANK